MARVRVCGACLQPVAACICDDEPDPEDSSEDEDAA